MEDTTDTQRQEEPRRGANAPPPEQQQQQQQQPAPPPQHQHNVSRATYPLPEPLVQRLRSGILLAAGGVDAPAGGTKRVVETFESALREIAANSIEAIDRMYFSTPARLRRHVEHRLCIRVRADPSSRTLSVTDLGIGMTRSDLINSLGIGRAGLLLTTEAAAAPKRDAGADGGGESDSTNSDSDRGTGTATDSTDDECEYEYEDDFTNDDGGEEQEEDEEEEEEQDEEDTETDDDDNSQDEDDDDDQEGNETEGDGGNAEDSGRSLIGTGGAAADAPIPSLPCRTKDLGGFYAALCSLGTGVQVATKSKHDDYYEFQIGTLASPAPVGVVDENLDSTMSSLSSFSIVRPYKEGTKLLVETGFDQFHHVRGDSGTCVTMKLNDAAVRAGLLDEENVLKPLFLKIVEATQYRVAFSSDAEQAQEIIQASAIEAEAVDHALQESDPLEGLGLSDVDVSSVAANEIAVGENSGVASQKSVKERAKYIPLRLSLNERKMLRLVEACMTCCDYTTEVDQAGFKSQSRRTHEQLRHITAVLRGLVTACNYEAGQTLLHDDNFSNYEKVFRQMFEIARRHKIMNPEKMRTEYGKMVYILQDAVSPTVKPHLGFSVVGPIQSVYKFLEERGGLDVLSDKLIDTATEEILAGKKSRAKIDNQIRAKERAVNQIKRKYRTDRLSSDDIHLCLYSICDNNSFLNSNRVPIDKIIDYLTSHFSPDKPENGYSLSIVSGEDGARLSHSHERQYYFALQSLTLWRDIIDDMFRLWAMGEEDLLSESVTYSLQDTGQGMQRVQQSPRTYQAMQQILTCVQKKVSHWVGSSVIHLGDHNVPNALSFIDKYTQGERA